MNEELTGMGKLDTNIIKHPKFTAFIDPFYHKFFTSLHTIFHDIVLVSRYLMGLISYIACVLTSRSCRAMQPIAIAFDVPIKYLRY